MKKLMFAMAAVAAGTVIADITSNNIVGYAGNELDTDYGTKIIAPQFVDVGADGITLDKLVPKCESDIDDYAIEIQVLDNGGFTIDDQDYLWVGGQWTDANGTPVAADKIKFAQGQGFSVGCGMGETPVTFQSSGEVSQEDVVVTLDTDYGCVLTGNPFPVAVALADITPECEGAIDDYSIEIQVLDNGGFTIDDQDYLWVGGQWTDPNGTPVAAESITFAAGQGFSVGCGMGETPVSLRIPAPEL